jgi:hypothetical protein
MIILEFYGGVIPQALTPTSPTVARDDQDQHRTDHTARRLGQNTMIGLNSGRADN